jgi:hypothetical protein
MLYSWLLGPVLNPDKTPQQDRLKHPEKTQQFPKRLAHRITETVQKYSKPGYKEHFFNIAPPSGRNNPANTKNAASIQTDITTTPSN